MKSCFMKHQQVTLSWTQNTQTLSSSDYAFKRVCPCTCARVRLSKCVSLLTVHVCARVRACAGMCVMRLQAEPSRARLGQAGILQQNPAVTRALHTELRTKPNRSCWFFTPQSKDETLFKNCQLLNSLLSEEFSRHTN
ncbi:hypothetical protein XENOCAPTIV_024357 [Xenoophorus captivus]|uniref:Uncharacterized protein n=1 Tax=Xenoophorus captivus TaxID=1517983 RepID=A0ABV0SB63_9TELE